MSQVPESTVAELRARGSVKWTDHRDALGAFVAEMDFGTAPAVTDALIAAVTNYQYGYLPSHLKHEFRRAFVSFALRRYGWELRQSQVRQIPDVLFGVESVVRLLLPPGAVIILPTPAYMPFLKIFDDLGCKVVQVPMLREKSGRYINDLAGIEQAFATAPGIAWLLLVNPHNPTGRVLSRFELSDIASIVGKYGGRVLADEIHAPLVYAGHQHIPYATISPITAAHTVTLVSASKAWNLAGLKAAQLILTNDDDLALWRKRGVWAEHLVATLGVVASNAAYEQGEGWLTDMLEYLAGNRKYVAEFLAAELPKTKFYAPEGTYLAWLDMNNFVAAMGKLSPADYLLKNAKVALTDGHECGAAGTGFVRLNFATPKPILETILHQIANALKISS